jgi:hypothetical protein
MSDSSQLPDYSITSNSLDTITISTNTVDLSSFSTSNLSSYSYSNTGMGTITIGPITSIDGRDINWNTTINLPVDWVDTFPQWARVQDMCKQYPSLEIALRNFQTIYQLVKDDYDNPTPKK